VSWKYEYFVAIHHRAHGPARKSMAGNRMNPDAVFVSKDVASIDYAALRIF
jgi:hypothetical protein